MERDQEEKQLLYNDSDGDVSISVQNDGISTEHDQRRTLFVILLVIFVISTILIIITILYHDKFFTKSAETPFNPITATINSIVAAVTRDDHPITCVFIVQSFLHRIKKYDKPKGINSIISLNPNVINEAQQLDKYYLNNSTLKGRLHCVPLLIKDNIDVANLITTGGINIFNNNKIGKAITNADIIHTLVNTHGAILIGKTNMASLAMDSHTSKSEVNGECHNPYSNKNRTCYGSSGGTAAAIASSFGVIGIGTDTSGSITLPSSGANIFGVRPPSQTVSFNGIMPSFRYSQVVGPMTKSLIDAVIVMDILMHTQMYSDETVQNVSKFRNITFGILDVMWYKTVLNGTQYEYTVHEDVFQMQQEMLSNLKRNNIIKNIVLNSVQFDTLSLSVHYQERCANACYSDDWGKYLLLHGNYTNIHELITDNNTPHLFTQKLNDSLAMDCISECSYYFKQRTQLRNIFNAIFDANDVDIIIFPGPPIPPFRLNGNYSEQDIEWSGIGDIWPAKIGYPAISVPIGFTTPIVNDAPLGLPVSCTFMSKVERFHYLFTAAYGYEQTYGKKQSPFL